MNPDLVWPRGCWTDVVGVEDGSLDVVEHQRATTEPAHHAAHGETLPVDIKNGHRYRYDIYKYLLTCGGTTSCRW